MHATDWMINMTKWMFALGLIAGSASGALAQTQPQATIDSARFSAIAVLSYCMFDGRQFSMGVTICNPLFNGKQGHSLTCEASDKEKAIAVGNPAVWKMKSEPDCPVPPYASGR